MANKKDVRSNYIKNLLSDKEALDKALKESTKESLNALVRESVNNSIREMLSESDDVNAYKEEDVNPDNELSFKANPEDNDADVSPESGNEASGESGDGEVSDNPEMPEDNEVWKDAEQWKDEDGEYDMTGKNIDVVLKLIQNMDPNTDGLRIFKTDDDTIEVTTDDGDELEVNINDSGDTTNEPNEFEKDNSENLDANDGMEPEKSDEKNGEEGMIDDVNLDNVEGENNSGDDDIEYELHLGDDNETDNEENKMVNEGDVNLGYTDNYQNKTAMTMPHDKGEGEGDSKFDKGAPTGDGKRWVGSKGANGGNPYTDKVNEDSCECNGLGCSEEDEAIFEVELDDENPEIGGEDPMMEGASTITRNNAYVNSTGRNQVHNPEQDDKVRNSHREAEQKRGTGYGRGTTSESKLTAINRQANAVLAENKELREIAGQIKTKLSEAVVINSSLAKVIKLITENTTTRDEKINILNRFDKVTSIKECNELYQQISEELKSTNVRRNPNINVGQISESKNNNMIVETNMLNASSELQSIIDFQDRLLKIK